MIITREKYESLTNAEFVELMKEFNAKYYPKFSVNDNDELTITFEDGFICPTTKKLTDPDIKDCYWNKELLFMTRNEIIDEVKNNRVQDAFIKDGKAYFRTYWTEEDVKETIATLGKAYCREPWTDWILTTAGTLGC